MDARRAHNRQLVTDFFTEAFVRGNVASATSRYIGADYVQHSPAVADGLAGLLACEQRIVQDGAGGPEVTILRVIADLDYVAVHSVVGSQPGSIRIDLFRVQEGRLVEHWDAAKKLVDPATIPHANGETDTVTTDAVSDAETNRRNIVQFYDLAFVQKRYVEAADRFFGDRYIQHNSFVPDGVEAYKEHFGESLTHAQSSYCQLPVRFVVDDEYAVVQVHLRTNLNDRDDRGIVIYDIFRFDGGLIVEHWDVGNEIPDPASSLHHNGVL